MQSMDEQLKQRRTPLRWPFKRDKQTQLLKVKETAQPSNSSQSSEDIDGDYDTQRTRNRHEEACNLLRRSIKACKQDNTSFLNFPDLEGEPATFDQQFLRKVNGVLESRKKDIKDETSWSKFRDTIECVFTALGPFSKNFLTIVTNAQSVLCTCSIRV